MKASRSIPIIVLSCIFIGSIYGMASRSAKEEKEKKIVAKEAQPIEVDASIIDDHPVIE